MGGIDQSVGPGLGGFLAFFLLACALWLLMRNMGKHLRNVDYRAQAQAKEADEARERAQAARDADDVQTRPRALGQGYPVDGDRSPEPPTQAGSSGAQRPTTGHETKA